MARDYLVVGLGANCMVDATRHGLYLLVVLVGDSSKARKGTSWSQIARLFAEVDRPWLSTCEERGFFRTTLRERANLRGWGKPLKRCSFGGFDVPIERPENRLTLSS
jgi:hypothetical protein